MNLPGLVMIEIQSLDSFCDIGDLGTWVVNDFDLAMLEVRISSLGAVHTLLALISGFFAFSPYGMNRGAEITILQLYMLNLIMPYCFSWAFKVYRQQADLML